MTPKQEKALQALSDMRCEKCDGTGVSAVVTRGDTSGYGSVERIECKQCAGTGFDAKCGEAILPVAIPSSRAAAERYRGLCKWAAGALLDAGAHKESQSVMDVLADIDMEAEQAAQQGEPSDEAILQLFWQYIGGTVDQQRCQRFARAVLALKPAFGWIACSERMPDISKHVLVAAEFDGPGDWRIKLGRYQPDCSWLIYGGSWTPTHWMPLPAAPQHGGE